MTKSLHQQFRSFTVSDKNPHEPITNTEYKSYPANKSSGETKPKVGTTASTIGNATKQYTYEFNKAYNDIEKTIMIRINESNTRRFRLYLIMTVLGTIWIISVFGTQIKKAVAKETAGLAKETLENESLKIQTQELAMAVVQTILNDKDVTAHAAIFLREASIAPETQQALLQLTLHVLQHPGKVLILYDAYYAQFCSSLCLV